uniref:Uncharacterized protein n=1 Tax=Arundo donax TaxID=35708 RepID=A0A0A9H2R2_ARUDO
MILIFCYSRPRVVSSKPNSLGRRNLTLNLRKFRSQKLLSLMSKVPNLFGYLNNELNLLCVGELQCQWKALGA